MIYNKLEILARPYRLRNSKKWMPNFLVVSDRRSKMHLNEYSADRAFNTRQDAVSYCFIAGKYIIDGLVPHCIVE